MRKYPFVVLGVCLLLFAALLTLTWPRPSKVTRENRDRIKEGMTLAEVEEILGGPAGDYRTMPIEYPEYPSGVPCGSLPSGSLAGWAGDEGAVEVYFCSVEPYTVIGTDFLEAGPKPGLVESLRWRLQRRWRQLWGP
jgi:hypothetical protein